MEVDGMKVAYPVIFTDVDMNILIEVPDLGIITEANEEGKAKGTMADDGERCNWNKLYRSRG